MKRLSAVRIVINKQTRLRIGITLLYLFSLLAPFFHPINANAATVTGYVRVDRMKAGQATGGTVCMAPSLTHTTSNTTVAITFSNGDGSTTGYTLNTTGANWTATVTNLPTGATAWPGIAAATPTVVGQTVTYTFSGNQTVDNTHTYCFNFPAASTLSSRATAASNLAGTILLTDTTPANNETVSWSGATITNDQIVVTGTVASTFSLTLSGNVANFSTNIPTSGSPATTPNITVTVSTNANNGWLGWVKNTTATSSLVSASTSDGICLGGNYPTCTGAAYQTGAGNVHSLSGAAGYGMNATTGTGSPTIATEYAGSATSFGSLDNTQYRQFASKNVPANANTLTLDFGAEATPTNKAATDYTDTVTVSAAGQF